ncbi:LiaF transmembrane domain-containing protein [Streptococcus dentasini]
MKKYFLGIVLLFLSVFLLFKDYLMPSPLSIWALLALVFLAYHAIKSLLTGSIMGLGICGVLIVIILNSQYHFIRIETWTLFLAVILACIGLELIFNPEHKWHRTLTYGRFYSSSNDGKEYNFGNSTRYIHNDNFLSDKAEVNFGNSTIYFDNALILGDTANFEVEVNFGNITLYIPKDWYVDLQVKTALGMAQAPQRLSGQNKRLVVTGDVNFGRLSIEYI